MFSRSMVFPILAVVLGLAEPVAADTSGTFTSLDEALKNPTAARRLILAGCNLHELPDSIGSLDRLEELVLSRNALSSLPQSIARLTRLRRLVLSDNPLGALPPWIGDLDALEELDAEHANLTAVPASIGRLSRLRALRLSNNKITSLPAEIGNASALVKLEISDNRLTTLPPEIGRLRELEGVFLFHNPITSLPSTIEQRGYLSVVLENTPLGKTGWEPPPAPPPPVTSRDADPAQLRAALLAASGKEALYTLLRQHDLLPTMQGADPGTNAEPELSRWYVFRPGELSVDLFHANLFGDTSEEKILQLRFTTDSYRDGVYILAFYSTDGAKNDRWRRVPGRIALESKRFTFSLVALRAKGESALVGDQAAPTLPDDNLKQSSRLLRVWQVTPEGPRAAFSKTVEAESYLSATNGGEEVVSFARRYKFVSPPGAEFPKRVRLDRVRGKTPPMEVVDLSFVAPAGGQPGR